MNLQKIYVTFTDDFLEKRTFPLKKEYDLEDENFNIFDIISEFTRNYPDYEVNEVYYKSPDNGTKLKLYPFKQDDFDDTEYIKQDRDEKDIEITNKYDRLARLKEEEDRLGLYDSLDSISVERCDDCNMEISKSKITNNKFRDSIKCKIVDSKSSISFDGKTEDVIDAVASATGMSKEDIINQLISKL